MRGGARVEADPRHHLERLLISSAWRCPAPDSRSSIPRAAARLPARTGFGAVTSLQWRLSGAGEAVPGVPGLKALQRPSAPELVAASCLQQLPS